MYNKTVNVPSIMGNLMIDFIDLWNHLMFLTPKIWFTAKFTGRLGYIAKDMIKSNIAIHAGIKNHPEEIVLFFAECFVLSDIIMLFPITLLFLSRSKFFTFLYMIEYVKSISMIKITNPGKSI